VRVGTRPGLDEATATQIANHLRHCELDFIPPLGERVDVDEYARKISRRARRFEAWVGGTLVGLLAVYCNDPAGEVAFITSVSVVREHHGQGIAKALLDRAIAHARQEGFRRMALEVGHSNAAAIGLYARAGFTSGDEVAGMVRMHLELQVAGKTKGRQ
jgi:ribosomal protein S18 acetylase RimI-like enzyme